MDTENDKFSHFHDTTSPNTASRTSSKNILPSEQKLADDNPVPTTVPSTTKNNTQSPVLDYNITNKPIHIISPVPDPLSALPPLSKLPPAMSLIKYSSPRKLHLPPADQMHTSIPSPITPRINTDDIITAPVNNITFKKSDPTESITWVQCETCLKWRKVSSSTDFDTWTCAQNIDKTYNTCTAPDQYETEIEQHTSLPNIPITVPSSNTPKVIQSSRPSRYSLRSGKSRDCSKLVQPTNSNAPYTSNDDQSSRPSKYFIRPHTCRDYKNLTNPSASKVLLQQALPPNKPLHVGAALKDKLRHHWIDCIFVTFDKILDTGTLSCPFPMSFILKNDLTILPYRLSFEVKLTDVDKFYELKCRICTDGSIMTEGIDFSESFAPTSDADSFRLIIALASSKVYLLIFYDVSNAFQTNVIDDPSKRHYLRLPPLYQQWFKQR